MRITKHDRPRARREKQRNLIALWCQGCGKLLQGDQVVIAFGREYCAACAESEYARRGVNVGQ